MIRLPIIQQLSDKIAQEEKFFFNFLRPFLISFLNMNNSVKTYIRSFINKTIIFKFLGNELNLTLKEARMEIKKFAWYKKYIRITSKNL